MGQLVSITASSRKKAEQALSELISAYEMQGTKVAKVSVALNLAPENTTSPYIRAVYDIHSRFNHLNTINDKLKNNDIVFIIGSAAETAFREASQFNSPKNFEKFVKWLNETELNSYGLPITTKDILITNTKNDHLNLFASVVNQAQIFKTSDKPKKIIAYINQPAKPETTKIVMYDILLLRAAGQNTNYKVITNNKFSDKKVKELVAGNELVAKKDGLASYYTAITTPLSAPVEVSANLIPKMHKTSVAKVIKAVSTEAALTSQSTTISFKPKNEIELAEKIVNNYRAETKNLTINQRLRLFETWLAGALDSNLQLANFDCTYSGYLSFYDFLYLSSKLSMKATWQQPSVYDGFIDCSAPAKIDSLVQELFDLSTTIAGSAVDSNEKYLLLGHKAYFSLQFSWQTLFRIYTFPLKGGSELVKEFQEFINVMLEEKFPTVTSILEAN